MQPSLESSPSDEPVRSDERLAAASNVGPSSELEGGDSHVPVLQWSGQRRFKYFVTGVIGPIACFAMAWSGMNARVDPLWQSGELDTYVTLMLEPKALLPFMPLLIYSLLSLAACCVRPELGRRTLVRLGVYTGGLLSAQYLFFVVFATSFFTFSAALLVGPGLALLTFLGAKLMPRARRIAIWQIMLLTTVVAVVAAVVSANRAALTEAGPRSALQAAAGFLFAMVIAVPILNCLTYVRAAFALLRSPALATTPLRDFRSVLALAFGWLVAFGTSWKFSLDAMLAEYARLPTTPPNCYVSSAAACGHRRFVGVENFEAAAEERSGALGRQGLRSLFNGEPGSVHGAAREGRAVCDLQNAFPVNDQMCRLKFLELALAAMSPRVHRIVRRAYNAFGPQAAAICRSSVWLADASYVAFKPLEWLAELIRVVAGVSALEVRGLYRTE